MSAKNKKKATENQWLMVNFVGVAGFEYFL